MPPGQRLLIAVLAVVAIGLRVAAFLDAPPLNTDEARYLIAAHHLRSGMGYADWRGPEIDIHPLHPFLVCLLGADPASLEVRGRCVALVCSILLLWPLLIAAQRLGGGASGFLFLLLAGLHPWLVRSAAPAQPESLYVLLVSLGLALVLPGSDRVVYVGRWTAAGFLFGLAYLARPEGLPVGLLVIVLSLVHRGMPARSEIVGACAFVAMLLVTSSTYLVFLKWATESWTVTGKVAELFFVGQSMYDAGNRPVDVSIYLGLIERWKGVLPFIFANPEVVLLRVLDNVRRILGWTVPVALGPAGLAGLIGSVEIFRQRTDLRRVLALYLAPCLTLLLMLLTFRNERVIGTVLPFLFVVSAVGMVALGKRLSMDRGRRRFWGWAGVLLSVLSLWTPSAIRLVAGQHPVFPERQAVRLALAYAGSGNRVASNSAVLSFYLRDPLMFGPPGNYHPLPLTTSCEVLAEELRARNASAALLETDLRLPAVVSGESHCLLRSLDQIEDPIEQHRITLLTWK